MRALLSASSLAFVLAGCGALRSPTFAPTAVASAVAPGCQLLIEGLFPNMAHDPVSLILSGRSRIYGYIYVPSLQGPFNGSQVRVQYQGERGAPWGGDSPLAGSVTFAGNRVQISLVHIIQGAKPDSMMFNGTYTLVGADACTGKT
jgi:hypothetical protein